jgi:hypothetical protein
LGHGDSRRRSRTGRSKHGMMPPCDRHSRHSKKRALETLIGPKNPRPAAQVAPGRFFCPIGSKEPHFMGLFSWPEISLDLVPSCRELLQARSAISTLYGGLLGYGMAG